MEQKLGAERCISQLCFSCIGYFSVVDIWKRDVKSFWSWLCEAWTTSSYVFIIYVTCVPYCNFNHIQISFFVNLMFTTSFCCINLVLNECCILQDDCMTCLFSVLFRSQNKKTKVSSTMTCTVFLSQGEGGQGLARFQYMSDVICLIIIYSFVCFAHHNVTLRLWPIELQMERFFWECHLKFHMAIFKFIVFGLFGYLYGTCIC